MTKLHLVLLNPNLLMQRSEQVTRMLLNVLVSQELHRMKMVLGKSAETTITMPFGIQEDLMHLTILLIKVVLLLMASCIQLIKYIMIETQILMQVDLWVLGILVTEMTGTIKLMQVVFDFQMIEFGLKSTIMPRMTIMVLSKTMIIGVSIILIFMTSLKHKALLTLVLEMNLVLLMIQETLKYYNMQILLREIDLVL